MSASRPRRAPTARRSTPPSHRGRTRSAGPARHPMEVVGGLCGAALLLFFALSPLPWSLLLVQALSLLWTSWAWWQDKHAAQRQTWRVPERSLLLGCALGGWPAGLVMAQRMRHKTVKPSFRWKFRAAVAVHLALLASLYLPATRNGLLLLHQIEANLVERLPLLLQ